MMDLRLQGVLLAFLGFCSLPRSYTFPSKATGRQIPSTEQYVQNSQLAQSGALAELQAQQLEASKTKSPFQQQFATMAVLAHQNQKNKVLQAQIAAANKRPNNFVPQTAAAVAAIDSQFNSYLPLTNLNTNNLNQRPRPTTIQALNQQQNQQLMLQLLAQQQQQQQQLGGGGVNSFQQNGFNGLNSFQPQQFNSFGGGNSLNSGVALQKMGLGGLNFGSLGSRPGLGGLNQIGNPLGSTGAGYNFNPGMRFSVFG